MSRGASSQSFVSRLSKGDGSIGGGVEHAWVYMECKDWINAKSER